MKKFILMTMTATLMAGCSTDEENECTSPPNEYPVEIMASAGVSGIQTRGPINTGQSVTAGFIASASGGDYSTNLWTAAGTFTASTTASATFSLTPAQYYRRQYSPYQGVLSPRNAIRQHCHILGNRRFQ